MDDEDRFLAKSVVSLLVIGLVVTAGAKVFDDLQNNPLACIADQSTGLYLSPLASIQTSISPGTDASQRLRNASFWSQVSVSYGKTIVELVPQTVLGLIQGSEAWKNWTMTYMMDPPSWIRNGPFSALNEQLSALQSKALGSHDSASALGEITSFATSVSGFTLESLDYVSFGGLTALKAYFETGGAEQALCTTFPGELARMYDDALSSGVPDSESAKELGTALAITSVMGLLGGLSGFSDQFQTTLAGLGLDGAWDSMKGSLDQLGTISPTAANLALTVMQNLAARFPGSIDSEAGLVAFRIDGMAEVLHDNGDSTSDIDQKISGLADEANSAPSPDYIADEADEISFEEGHALVAVVGDQYHLYRWSDGQTKQYFDPAFLQQNVPGFVAGTNAFFKVYYFEDSEFTYNYYGGGKTWTATVPSDIAKPGEVLTIYVTLLTPSDFIASIPPIELTNSAGFRWMPASTSVDSFTLSGNQIILKGVESPTLEGVSTFSITTQVESGLQFAPGQGPYVQFGVQDMFGNVRDMRIYFDGYDAPSLRIDSGGKFPPVSMLSFDGSRLSVMYGSPGLYIATIYESSPAVFYQLGDMVAQPLDFQVKGASQVYQIQQVTLLGQLANSMLTSNSLYAHGRLGAEIAYAVAIDKLGLTNVIIGEPSQGGPDLWTQDQTVVLEARFLTISSSAQGSSQAALDVCSRLNSAK